MVAHVDPGTPAPALMDRQRTRLSVHVAQPPAILSVACFVILKQVNAAKLFLQIFVQYVMDLLQTQLLVLAELKSVQRRQG